MTDEKPVEVSSEVAPKVGDGPFPGGGPGPFPGGGGFGPGPFPDPHPHGPVAMRAKVRVSAVLPFQSNGELTGERLILSAVAAHNYGPDGSDEDNSYARWTPSASFDMYITNPALFSTFKVGDAFYVDFIPAQG